MKTIIFITALIAVAVFIIWFDKQGELAFWFAKRRANKLHKSTGKRYYVVPINNRLKVIGSHTLAKVNRKLPKRKRISIDKLLIESYYHTK